MLARYFRLAFIVLLFTQSFYMSNIYAETPARLEIERIQRKFQGRWHAVHPVRLCGTNTYITWPKKMGSDADTPNYPADGYYGNLSTTEQISLIQDLANRFWHTNYIANFYIKAIDGLQEIVYCGDPVDMPDLSLQPIADLDSAYTVLQNIEDNLDSFTRCILPSQYHQYVNGISSVMMGGWLTTDYEAVRAYAENDNFCSNPAEDSKKVITYESTEVHNINGNRPSAGCEAYRTNSRITCDFSDYNISTAVCYLRAQSSLYRMYENPMDPGSANWLWVDDGTPYSGDFPVAGDNLYWAWAWTIDDQNNPVTNIADTVWTSPYLFTNINARFFADIVFTTFSYADGSSDRLGATDATWELTGTAFVLTPIFEDEQ